MLRKEYEEKFAVFVAEFVQGMKDFSDKMLEKNIHFVSKHTLK